MRSIRRLGRTTPVVLLMLAVTRLVGAGDDPLGPSSQSQVPSRPGLASPQTSGASGTGGAAPGTPGAMNVPPPYDPNAAPGTTPPSGPSASGADGGQGLSPSQMFGAGNPGAGTDFAAGSGGAPSSGLGGFGSSAQSAFAMIGDASPLIGRTANASADQSNPPPPPPPGARSRIAPSVRGFKIAENQSPVPQDRVYFSFNYFNDVNKTLNRFFEAPIQGVEIYRYVFGFEKTFNQGLGSVGIRVPINNVFARSAVSGLNQGGNSTALGNLTIYAKHIFAINRETGSLATGGVAISPQSAPGRFGGAPFLAPSNTTSIQPFFAFLINRERWYLQGFTAIDVPADPAQPTLIYNDLGLGYFVYKDNSSLGLITAVAPTVEVHANTPINHTGPYNPFDANGSPTIVNITSGLNTRIKQNSILTMGVVTPVTGPRPFSIEGTVLLNVYFGRSRRNPAPPIIGG